MTNEDSDQYTPEGIQAGLTTSLIGQKLFFYPTTSSTNEQAKVLARQGAPEGTIVVADCQLNGKGRRGRTWNSPAGQGVLCTVILRPPLSPAEASKLVIMAAVAVQKAINNLYRLKVGIKWPNDLVYRGKKLAGILLESKFAQAHLEYVILGIGVNVNTPLELFPPELQQRASSLGAELGQKVSRTALLQELLAQLEDAYDLLKTGQGRQVLKAWQDASVTLGQEVQLEEAGQLTTGKAEGIDEQGALLVRLANGELVKVISGEVSVRNSEGTYV